MHWTLWKWLSRHNRRTFLCRHVNAISVFYYFAVKTIKRPINLKNYLFNLLHTGPAWQKQQTMTKLTFSGVERSNAPASETDACRSTYADKKYTETGQKGIKCGFDQTRTLRYTVFFWEIPFVDHVTSDPTWILWRLYSFRKRNWSQCIVAVSFLFIFSDLDAFVEFTETFHDKFENQIFKVILQMK